MTGKHSEPVTAYEVEPCPFHGNLTLDRTTKTWGLGRCCLGCGMPVVVRVLHMDEAYNGGAS